MGLLAALTAAVVIAAGAAGWIAAANLRGDVTDLRRANENYAQQSTATARDISARVGTLEAAAANATDPAALAEGAAKSVFTVETETALGSAWVAASAGGGSQLVTNFHVIADTHHRGERTVRIRRGDLTYEATITGTNEADDLAILSVTVALPALPVAPAEPKPGAPVLVVGSPLGLEGSVSSGIVSAVRTEEGVRYIQFTAPISPGNSGGPVLDASGHVIGVSEAKAVSASAEGLSFAVPSARVCEDFDVC